MLIGDSGMKTARPNSDSYSEETGRVWIWVKEDTPILEETIVQIKLTVVNELIDATILQTTDADLVIRKANEEYSTYLWRSVPCERTGEFVVQGELRG
jgi:hypothetical protein